MNTKVKPRKGASNKGQEYEIRVPALFSLIFLQDPTIKNFSLSNSIKGFSSLDDLVIHLEKYDGTVEKYALQLKHKEKKDAKIYANGLESKHKHDFSIVKYCEEFSQISVREDYNFILYTNANVHQECSEKVPYMFTGTHPAKEYFFVSDSESDSKIYSFESQAISRNLITDVATKEVYESFFKKFALFTGQSNFQGVQRLVEDKFREIFHTESSVATEYISIFQRWKLKEYTNAEITRDELVIKILDLILSPSIIAPSACTNEKFNLLEQAFSKFDIVLLHDFSEEEVGQTISPANFEGDLLHIAKNMKFLQREVKINDLRSTKIEELKQKIAYYTKEKPIVIKINKANKDTIQNAILKFKSAKDKLHFVLSGEKNIERDKFDGCTIFETLYDLKEKDSEIYGKLVQEMKFSVAGEQHSYCELGRNDELAKMITIKNIFNMLSGNFCLNADKEILTDLYIPRFLSSTFIKIESATKISGDLLIIGCNDNTKHVDFLRDVISKKMVTVEEFLKEPQNDVVVCQNHLTLNHFQEICDKSPSKNVHLFEVHNEEFLEWVSTKGDLKNLKECERFGGREIDETSVFQKCINQINVIVARPGMGKSEILRRLKNLCPTDFFPIMVVLNEHNAFFKETHSEVETLEYFLNYSNDGFLLLEMKRCYAQKKKLTFFFDGLDELHLDVIISALTYIKMLSAMGFGVWLSSRPHLEDIIEDHLNVFPMDIKPFSEQDQKYYIRGRLKNEEDMETMVDAIFQNFDTILENRDILDIPLQLYIITDILIKSRKGVTPNMFILTQMFRHFIYENYRYLFTKANCNHIESLEVIVNDGQRYRMKQYQIAGLKSCLVPSEFDSLNLHLDEDFVEEIQTKGDALGFVVKIKSKTVVFHHIMTATYFAALWFAKNFRSHAGFLKTILFKKENTHLRLLFDMILAEDSPAHVAVLYRDIKALEKCGNEIFDIDKGGRSTLHLACSHSCRYLNDKTPVNEMRRNVIETLRKIDQEFRKILEFLLEKDFDLFRKERVLDMNCFDFAIKTSLLPLEVILNSKHRKDLEEYIFNLEIIKDHPLEVLGICAIFSYSTLFRNILDDMSVPREDKQSLLYSAVMFNNYKIVNILLEDNPNVEKVVNERGLLHKAATFGNLEVVMLLHLKEADINAPDEIGRTPLHLAASKGHIKVVKKLFQLGAKINQPDRYGRTPLHLAIETGNEDLFQMMVNFGASIEKLGWNGWGCLHIAILKSHATLVRILLDKNVDISSFEQNGNKPVHMAATCANTDILDMILDKTKKVDDETRDGRTSLHLVAEIGNANTFTHLVKRGANINAKDKTGRSVLHSAVICQNPEIVELLLENKVQVEVVDNFKRNCLHWAAHFGNSTIMDLLVDKLKHKINDRCINGNTPLHWACNGGHNFVVEILTTHGAKIDINDNQGRSPLYWAAMEGHVTTVKLLLKKGAEDVRVGGMSALNFAKSKRRYQ